VIREFKERGLTFTCTSRVDLLMKHFDELRENGLYNVYIGIESLDDSSLAGVRKDVNASLTEALLKRLEDCGRFAFGTYMLCLDHDTVESVQQAVEKLSSFRALYGVVFWIATPFPGTDYYDRLEAAGEIWDRDPKHYDALHLVHRHPNISPEGARELLCYCVKNHCHADNIRKAKLLRKWADLERRAASASRPEGESALAPATSAWA
jgi:radical SAM superfamily enzyme YgiQ (UPF0313 family)